MPAKFMIRNALSFILTYAIIVALSNVGVDYFTGLVLGYSVGCIVIGVMYKKDYKISLQLIQAQFGKQTGTIFMLVVSVSMMLISSVVVYGISHSLAKWLQLDELFTLGVVLFVFAFIGQYLDRFSTMNNNKRHQELGLK